MRKLLIFNWNEISQNPIFYAKYLIVSWVERSAKVLPNWKYNNFNDIACYDSFMKPFYRL